MKIRNLLLCCLASLSLCSCGKKNDRAYTLEEIVGVYQGPREYVKDTNASVEDYSLTISINNGEGYGVVSAYFHNLLLGQSVFDSSNTKLSGKITLNKKYFYIGSEKGCISNNGQTIEILKKTFTKTQGKLNWN